MGPRHGRHTPNDQNEDGRQENEFHGLLHVRDVGVGGGAVTILIITAWWWW